MNDRGGADILVQPTLFGSDTQRRVIVNGRMAATIQKGAGVWRIVIPFGKDHDAYPTMDDAVDAVVEMVRPLDTNGGIV